MEHLDEGVFLAKAPQAASATPLILSCGVHGDETLPVAVLEQLLEDIRLRMFRIQRPCLLIFANAQALANRRRFMKHNMNRLFGASTRPPGYEGRRVAELEDYCRDFADMFGKGWHLDLHSTIKPSLHPSFALQPAGTKDYDTRWLPTLARAKVSALVRQRTPSHTFSHFTANDLGYESFTLECGAVGSQEVNQSVALGKLVRELLMSPGLTAGNAAPIQEFDVALELIKMDPDFHFLVDESVPNFVSFPAGTPIAVNDGAVVQAPVADCALLFANSNVPVGDRAALLLRPIAAPACNSSSL